MAGTEQEHDTQLLEEFVPETQFDTDSNATTVDQAQQTALADTASSDQGMLNQSISLSLLPGPLLETQTPTLILDTQEMETQMLPTLILESQHVPKEQADEPPKKQVNKPLASLRVQSLRASALAAYERLLQKLKQDRGQGLPESTNPLMIWGLKQRKDSLVDLSIGEEWRTPTTQPSINLTAMCSNNKAKMDGGSPKNGDSALDKIRKVLFEPPKVNLEDRRDVIVATVETALDKVTGKERELSYLNSQEPGEESQAHAMQVLDRFVVSMCGEFSQEAQLNEFDTEKKKPQNLNLLTNVAELQKKNMSVFDFLGTQEDVTAIQRTPKEVDKDGAAAEHVGQKVTTPTEVKRQSKTTTGKKKLRASARTPSTRGKRRLDGDTKSTTRSSKRKEEPEHELILMDDTPRKCRRKPIRVLFSAGLGKETIEQQKKIVSRLKFECAETAMECTHFVTDKFSRSANMMQALASGKPVVSLGWLESCDVAGCAVDEKNFLLQDYRKEREFGFSMHTTFTSAQHKPLLTGTSVYVTPSAMEEPVPSVINAAGGKLVSEDDASDEECIVISCDKDRKLCQRLLRQGVKVYSAEFLFSGVVSYRLDFSRNILFEN